MIVGGLQPSNRRSGVGLAEWEKAALIIMMSTEREAQPQATRRIVEHKQQHQHEAWRETLKQCACK